MSFFDMLQHARMKDFHIGSDGSLLCWLLWMAYGERIDRLSFDLSSFPTEYFSSQWVGKNIGLIGGSGEEVKRATEHLSNLFPGVNFYAVSDGYRALERKRLRLLLLNADVVVVSTGHPRQNDLALAIYDMFPKGKLIFTSGAFITQTAIRPHYYSAWIDRFNLRWLQRAISSQHVRRRLVVNYPLFIFRFLYNLAWSDAK